MDEISRTGVEGQLIRHGDTYPDRTRQQLQQLGRHRSLYAPRCAFRTEMCDFERSPPLLLDFWKAYANSSSQLDFWKAFVPKY